MKKYILLGMVLFHSIFSQAQQSPLRILCGATQNYTDSEGNTWVIDQPYVAGSWGYINNKLDGSAPGVDRTMSFDGGTPQGKYDPTLFKKLRFAFGSSFYLVYNWLEYQFDNIQPGKYEVKLYFAEFFQSQAGQRVMDIRIQNLLYKNKYDIIKATGAKATSDCQSFVIEVDGAKKISIQLLPYVDTGMVNAIEILPTEKPLTKPIPEQQLPPVSITPTGGKIKSRQPIQLSGSNGSDIYYTLDGSDPVISSTRKKYTTPIIPEGSGKVVLKTYMENPDYLSSFVMTETYYLTETVIPPVEQSGNTGREEITLNSDWRLWRDTQAKWENDKLYLPNEVDLALLPVNPPTGGWDILTAHLKNSVAVDLPATVEEFFTANGLVDDISCRGVSWFWKEVYIPENWQGKTITLKIQNTRLRAEIYVNDKLSGYDIVGEVPYDCDISSAIDYGKKNRLAIRITNPGGNRGWGDFPAITWGNYILPPGHDFGGIGGDIQLVVSNNTFISDVFVRNEQGGNGRDITVKTTVRNKQGSNIPLKMTIEIIKEGKALFSQQYDIHVNEYIASHMGYRDTEIAKKISVPQALLWDADNPNIYQCKVSVISNTKNDQDIADEYTTRFGFRTFEVKNVDGKENFYLNNKRLILKSAIDWGYYALTGLYPTEEMAYNSVLSAKKIGHNSINFHRQIGHPSVIRNADEQGLYLYEEIGGFHGGGLNGCWVEDGSFTGELFVEKFERMIKRDRNYPSLLVVNLCNEDIWWDAIREKTMRRIHALDGSRLIINTSGGNNGGLSGPTPHMRPYESEIRKDFQDEHTVNSQTFFPEDDLKSHSKTDDKNIFYWGEVRCYVGPENYYQIANVYDSLKLKKGASWKGYNYSYYLDFGTELKNFFDRHDMAHTGSQTISSPGKIAETAGNGKMYKDGRISQTIMSWDSTDGYAINGWSSGNGTEGWMGWYSGIVDDARHLKGDSQIYAYYTRAAQIAIARINGCHFKPGETAQFRIRLINQGIIEKGEYTVKLRVKDGNGIYHDKYEKNVSLTIESGDVFAQTINDLYSLPLDSSLKGGYITLEAELYNQAGKLMTDGCEQILLSNRNSFKNDFVNITGAVHNWNAAALALSQAEIAYSDFKENTPHSDFIAAGNLPSDLILDNMLTRVKEEGSLLVIKFDTNWAAKLFEKGILSKPVTHWDTPQNGFWNGNGWGYIDYFAKNPSTVKPILTTTDWEVNTDPVGFFPFESNYKTEVYGTYIARPNTIRVLIGMIHYGKGRIILQPSYTVDNETPISDLLFYNIIKESSKISSVYSPKSEKEITIYPEVTSDIIHIASNDPVKSITIYSINGKTMYKCEDKDVVSLANLSSGTYCVQVMTNSSSVTKNIIKR